MNPPPSISAADIRAIVEAVKEIALREGGLFEAPEYGDARLVFRLFNLRPSHLYELLRRGKIRTALVPGRGGRGRRLFVLRSIREHLASLEDNGENRCAPIPRAEIPPKRRPRKVPKRFAKVAPEREGKLEPPSPKSNPGRRLFLSLPKQTGRGY